MEILFFIVIFFIIINEDLRNNFFETLCYFIMLIGLFIKYLLISILLLIIYFPIKFKNKSEKLFKIKKKERDDYDFNMKEKGYVIENTEDGNKIITKKK